MSESATPPIPALAISVLAPLIEAGVKQLDANKVRRRPGFDDVPVLRKPAWIRVSIPSGNAVGTLKRKLRENHLVTVCEDAGCPNIHECWNAGTATFMILGDICTRRCSFCQVASGRPKRPDAKEPDNLARTIADMGLRYVVITSVDRDDLHDAGAQHFADCIRRIRALSPLIKIEILTPDFKGKLDDALAILKTAPPDVFNHNLETVRGLYHNVRPGADYDGSLQLLQKFKAQHPELPTKSGIMLGLGETREQVEDTLRDLRAHGVNMITIGQYLRPSPAHHPVIRYWTPEEFQQLQAFGMSLGFAYVASGPMVRSSYHADRMADAAGYVTLDRLKRGQRSLPDPA